MTLSMSSMGAPPVTPLLCELLSETVLYAWSLSVSALLMGWAIYVNLHAGAPAERK